MASNWQPYQDYCFGPVSDTVQMVMDYQSKSQPDVGGGQAFMDHLGELAEAIRNTSSEEKDFLDDLESFLERLLKLIEVSSVDQLMAYLQLYQGVSGRRAIVLRDLFEALAAMQDGFRDWTAAIVEQFERFPTNTYRAESEAWPITSQYFQSTAPIYYYIAMYAPTYIERRITENLKQADELDRAVDAASDPGHPAMNKRTPEEQKELRENIPGGKARSFVLRRDATLMRAILDKQQATLGMVANLEKLKRCDQQAILKRRIKPLYSQQLKSLKSELFLTSEFTQLAASDPYAKLDQIEEHYPEQFKRIRELESLLARWENLSGEELKQLTRNAGADPDYQPNGEDRLRFVIESWLLLMAKMDDISRAFSAAMPFDLQQMMPVEIEFAEELIQTLSHTGYEGLLNIASKYNIPVNAEDFV